MPATANSQTLAAKKKMKTALLVIFLVLGASCATENSKSEIVADIDENLFNSFKKEVLDTLIGQDLLVDIPKFSGLFGASRYIKYDSLYFDRYLEKVAGLKWKGTGTVQKKEIDQLFEDNIEDGYEEFRNRYGQRCFVQISVPFFSIDRSEVFFTMDRHCSGLGGHCMDYHYKKENGKWKLISSSETWVS